MIDEGCKNAAGTMIFGKNSAALCLAFQGKKEYLGKHKIRKVR